MNENAITKGELIELLSQSEQRMAAVFGEAIGGLREELQNATRDVSEIKDQLDDGMKKLQAKVRSLSLENQRRETRELASVGVASAFKALEPYQQQWIPAGRGMVESEFVPASRYDR